MNKFTKLLIPVIISLITSLNSDAIKIVDGWTWRYEGWGNWYEYTFDYQFDGTKIIDGREYHVFRNIAAQKRVVKGLGDGYYDYEIELSLPWYVRQEEGKFFVYPNWENRVNEEPYGDWWPLYTASNTDDAEILIYDFNTNPGVEYLCCQGSESNLNAKVIEEGALTHNASNIDYQEVEYQYGGSVDITLPKTIVSEEFGILEDGFLVFPTVCVVPGRYELRSGPGLLHCHLKLGSITDEQGNVIYDANPLASSPELEMYTNQLNQLIDLHGREISNPLPGSIYILNGKKIVGK